MKGFTLIELLIIVAILVVIVAAIVSGMGPSMTLQKSEWTCTKHETRFMPMMVGKIVTQQPHRVCVQWSRR